MKKYLLILFILLGGLPYLKQGHLQFSNIHSVYADDFGDEGNGDGPAPDYSALYESLSNLFGFDIVGTTEDSYGHTLFVTADGGLVDPIGATITDTAIHNVAEANPDIFPPDMPLPLAEDFTDLDDFLNYVSDLDHVSQIPDEHTNTTNNVADPCIKGVVDRVINGDADNPFSNILHTLFGSSTQNTIDFTSYTNNATTNIDGTTSGQPGSLEIALNLAALQNASQEEVMATIYHEILHAYMDEMHITDQHNKMATDYLEVMASQLKSDFPNLTTDQATALAWGGLGDTTRWQNLSSTDKNNNLVITDNFKNLNNVNNGAYGTPHCNP